MRSISGEVAMKWRTARMEFRDTLRLITPAMFFYIAAQFACWTLHDAIQEYMFKQVRFRITPEFKGTPRIRPSA